MVDQDVFYLEISGHSWLDAGTTTLTNDNARWGTDYFGSKETNNAFDVIAAGNSVLEVNIGSLPQDARGTYSVSLQLPNFGILIDNVGTPGLASGTYTIDELTPDGPYVKSIAMSFDVAVLGGRPRLRGCVRYAQ